jgi:hypothetical protein
MESLFASKYLGVMESLFASILEGRRSLLPILDAAVDLYALEFEAAAYVAFIAQLPRGLA